MRPKVILLDWDGTIIDGFPHICQAMNETLVHYGKEPWDNATLATQVPRPDAEKFPEIFGEHYQEPLRFFYNRLTQIGEGQEKPKLIPGAESFMAYIQELRASGVYVGIVSNSRHASIERELRQLGWENMVDVIVASDDVEKKKPNPESYSKALMGYPNAQKTLPSETLYVGDANTDRDFARNCGMKFLGISDKFNPPLAPEEHMSGLEAIVRRLRLAERTQGISK